MFSEHVIKVLIKKGKEWMWNQVDTESGDRVADFQLPLFWNSTRGFHHSLPGYSSMIWDSNIDLKTHAT